MHVSYVQRHCNKSELSPSSSPSSSSSSNRGDLKLLLKYKLHSKSKEKLGSLSFVDFTNGDDSGLSLNVSLQTITSSPFSSTSVCSYQRSSRGRS